MILGKTFRLLVLVSAVLLIFGAGGPSAATDDPMSVAQSSVAAPLKEIVFRKELTIGVVEGDENYMFGKSVDFSVDEQGNIYALDWDKKQIRKFGPDGKYILTIGRQGQGPGEFQNPSKAGFAPDGNIYVSENFGNKVYFFSPDGRFLDQKILPDKIFDIRIGPTGVRLGIRQKNPQYVGQGATEATYTIFDDQYQPIIELYKDVIDIAHNDTVSEAQMYADISTYFLAHPNPVAVMGNDGRIYFGCTSKYAINVYSPDGKKLRTISRDVPASPYERKDIDFILKTYEEEMYADRSETLRKDILKLIKFPKFKPVFSEMVPLDDGFLAIMLDKASLEMCFLDLFDREGVYRGCVEAKISPRGLQFKDAKAYSIRTDESGYVFIERYSYKIR